MNGSLVTAQDAVGVRIVSSALGILLRFAVTLDNVASFCFGLLGRAIVCARTQLAIRRGYDEDGNSLASVAL